MMVVIRRCRQTSLLIITNIITALGKGLTPWDYPSSSWMNAYFNWILKLARCLLLPTLFTPRVFIVSLFLLCEFLCAKWKISSLFDSRSLTSLGKDRFGKQCDVAPTRALNACLRLLGSETLIETADKEWMAAAVYYERFDMQSNRRNMVSTRLICCDKSLCNRHCVLPALTKAPSFHSPGFRCWWNQNEAVIQSSCANTRDIS